MKMPRQIVVFTIETLRYGIPLAAVDRVVRMVEITLLPGAPEFIRGVINVQGMVIPVIDLRQHLGLPLRAIGLSDQLLIINAAGRHLALIVDAVIDVCEYGEWSLTETADIFPGLPFLTGVAKLPDGMILIEDPEKLLSPQNLQMMEHAVGQGL